MTNHSTVLVLFQYSAFISQALKECQSNEKPIPVAGV
jgi:hypothetical protein